MDCEVPHRGGDTDGIRALVWVDLAHRAGAVYIDLHLHLPLVGKQLDEVLLKTAVQVPVDAADVIPQHILPVIGKLHGLPIGVDQMLTAEVPAEIPAEVECKRLQTTEECVV